MWIDPDGNPFAYYEKSSKYSELHKQFSTDEPESAYDEYVYIYHCKKWLSDC